jgi:PPIC-type peptidyl-prolyl cis-trans isomerase-like protein/SurA-like protein
MKITPWRSRFFRSLRAGRALCIPHRGQAPLLGALLLAVALMGCGPSGAADPVLAAQVNDRAISMGDYQALLRYARAAAGVSNTPADWQSPAGRAGLGVFQDQVMTYLIQSALLDDQIAKCGVTISAKDQSAASGAVEQTVSQLSAQQGQHPEYGPVIAAYTPALKRIFSVRDVDERTVAQSGAIKTPSAHMREILAGSVAEAQQLRDQARKGADFGQLAKAHSQDQQTGASGGELGIIYQGQITQLGPDFDRQAFAGVKPKHADGCLNANTYAAGAVYVIIPVRDQAFLFEVTQRADRPIKGISDQQTRQAALMGWLNEPVKDQAHITQFVTAPTREQPAQP